MEEILASIRRIIADDQAPKPAEVEAPPAPPPAPPSSLTSLPPLPEDDVLDLAEVAEPVRKSEPAHKPEPLGFDVPEIDFRTSDAEPDFEDPFDFPSAPQPARAPEPTFEPEPAAFAPPPPPAPAANERIRAAVEAEVTDRLVSARAGDSVGQSFQLLAHTVLAQNARTLEDLVQDMLRPMLKSWLDENLPHMVERLVRSEIERVARGR